MLRTEILTGPSAVADLREEWQALVSDSATAAPFQTWEWQSTWANYYLRRRKPILLTVREGKDLIGLYPLMKSAGLWRSLRPMGVGGSDYLHPIAHAGMERVVEEAMFHCLQEVDGIDLIDLHQIRENHQLVSEDWNRDSVQQATCLLLDLPETYENYLAMLGKSLRYDVRRLDKTLFREGKASVDQVEEGEIGKGLEILFDQHKKRWRKRGLPGAFIGKTQEFHHAWGKVAIERGWLWLSILKFEGEPIGAIYAMRLGHTCYYYQAGFDPCRGSISPGTLLVAATIRRAIEEGAQHFDFLRGDEPYKRRWKPQHEFKNLRLMMSGESSRGETASRWNIAGSKVEAKLRARLEGKGLLG